MNVQTTGLRPAWRAFLRRAIGRAVLIVSIVGLVAIAALWGGSLGRPLRLELTLRPDAQFDRTTFECWADRGQIVLDYARAVWHDVQPDTRLDDGQTTFLELMVDHPDAPSPYTSLVPECLASNWQGFTLRTDDAVSTIRTPTHRAVRSIAHTAVAFPHLAGAALFLAAPVLAAVQFVRRRARGRNGTDVPGERAAVSRSPFLRRGAARLFNLCAAASVALMALAITTWIVTRFTLPGMSYATNHKATFGAGRAAVTSYAFFTSHAVACGRDGLYLQFVWPDPAPEKPWTPTRSVVTFTALPPGNAARLPFVPSPDAFRLALFGAHVVRDRQTMSWPPPDPPRDYKGPLPFPPLPPVHLTLTAALVPYPHLICATTVLPAVWLIGHRRRRRVRHRLAHGLCPACGYDVRATPGRCTECGWGIPSGPGR